MIAFLISGCAVTKHNDEDLNADVYTFERAALTTKKFGGLAPYALLHPKWPCDRTMEGFKDLPDLKLAILWNTFGTDTACLDRWAKDPRPKTLEVHLINEVCHRNNRCGKYEMPYGLALDAYRTRLTNKNPALISKIQNNVNPIANWFRDHSDVQCYVSAGLESNLDAKAYQSLVQELKPLFPDSCVWVWNPVGNNRFGTKPIAGFVHEMHGSDPILKPPCIANLDGEDIDLKSTPTSSANKIGASEIPGFLASYASCDAAFLWHAPFNGIEPGSFVDPRKRSKFSTVKAMRELNGMIKKPIDATEPGDFNEVDFKGCKRFLKTSDGAKKGFLWKQSDVDIYGAVTLLPEKEKYSRVVVKKNGKVLDELKFAYLYTEDRSNRQVWRASKKAGSFPVNVVLKADFDCYKLANPRIRND